MVDEKAHRIIVSNFDTVSQAELWLTQGARRATEIFLGLLRTAVLLGAEVVVDRNQVFDGVFFLALGPERIAQELGLPPDCELPLVMNCAPNDCESGSVPRLLGQRAPAHRPELGHVCLDAQISQVRSAGFASSALAAVSGLHPDNGWLYPEPGPAWFPGCGFVDAFHPLDKGDVAAANSVIEAAQEQWRRAADQARLGVDLWGGSMDLPSALARQREALVEAAGELSPAPLAEHILAMEEPRRSEVLIAVHDWRSEHGTPDVECRLAAALWSRGYYQAIADQNGAMLVSFNVDEYGPGGTAALPLLRRYGQALPVRSAWQRWLDRRRRPTGRRVRVQGEILDHLRIVDPGTFRQLTHTTRPVVASLVTTGDPDAMFDLALACRHAVELPASHREARTALLLRIVSMTLLAVGVTVLSVLGSLFNLSPAQNAAAVVASALLGLIAAIPWEAIVEEFRLRPSAMTATLNLTEDRR